MIIVRRKSLDDIGNMVGDHTPVLILGCESCAAVVNEGGKRQADQMAIDLENKRGESTKIATDTVRRQCDKSVILARLSRASFQGAIDKSAAIISLSCGAGMQTLVELFPQKLIIPGTDTLFLGDHPRDETGGFVELCRACGDCMLFETGGICPITRCAKSLMNGPCGGVIDGKCEVGNYTNDCAWYLIWKRLKDMNQLEQYTQYRPPQKFAQSMGAPRRFNPSNQTEA